MSATPEELRKIARRGGTVRQAQREEPRPVAPVPADNSPAIADLAAKIEQLGAAILLIQQAHESQVTQLAAAIKTLRLPVE